MALQTFGNNFSNLGAVQHDEKEKNLEKIDILRGKISHDDFR